MVCGMNAEKDAHDSCYKVTAQRMSILQRGWFSYPLSAWRQMYFSVYSVNPSKIPVRPRPYAIMRKPVPLEVPDEFAKDYREASLVLSISPNASAALSRRCLQHILRNKLSVRQSRLKDEIDEVIERRETLPQISESLHHLRQFGNFAAHPDTDRSTGEIVPVEPGEAEWCLEVIEMVFEVYFAWPAKQQAMQKAIDSRRSRT